MSGEKIMRTVDAQLKERSGCVIAGRAVWNLCLTDDTTLFARSREELIQQTTELDFFLYFGLKINAVKMHISWFQMMTINPSTSVASK